MNFLQLVQRLRQECGVSAGTTAAAPSTTVNQNGEMRRLVDWINAGWLDLQTRHDDWLWMRAGFTLPTVSGTHTYTAADASITDFREWSLDSLKVYTVSTTDETELFYVSYEEFRSCYMLGQIASGRPAYFTVTPDRSLRFYPTPDAAYTVYGDYQRMASEMSADTDIPSIPTEYHLAIVYRAMIKYGRYEAASEIYEDARAEYARILSQLERKYLPEMSVGTFA